MSDRIAVMYLGKIVELVGRRGLLENPSYPYVQVLLPLCSMPDPDGMIKKVPLKGEITSSMNPPSEARFHPRCPHAENVYKEEAPSLTQAEAGHFIACHFRRGEILFF